MTELSLWGRIFGDEGTGKLWLLSDASRCCLLPYLSLQSSGEDVILWPRALRRERLPRRAFGRPAITSIPYLSIFTFAPRRNWLIFWSLREVIWIMVVYDLQWRRLGLSSEMEGVKDAWDFLPEKNIPCQAVLQDNRDAVGPQDESWEVGVFKLSPSLGCYLGTFMDSLVLIATALKWSLISWILEVRNSETHQDGHSGGLMNDFNTQVSSLCLGWFMYGIADKIKKCLLFAAVSSLLMNYASLSLNCLKTPKDL